MGTALDRASELLDLVNTAAADAEVGLPAKQWIQAGDAVVPCESVVVSAQGLGPPLDFPDRCAPPQETTITCVIARDWICVDRQGNEDPEAIEEASETMIVDGDVLWAAVYAMTPFPGPPQNVSVSWLIEGGLVYTSVNFTIGVI